MKKLDALEKEMEFGYDHAKIVIDRLKGSDNATIAELDEFAAEPVFKDCGRTAAAPADE